MFRCLKGSSHPHRFTARVSELLTVLNDMEKGVYQRTMVNPTAAESAEDGTCTLKSSPSPS